jgi:hypothetical protein
MSVTHKKSIGILTYDTINIGDWTQTAATMYAWWQYVKRPDTFKGFVEKCIATSTMNGIPITWINRDRIKMCVKPDGIDEVVVVCNGWWMHKHDNVFQFPPPDWITPMYISMHIHEPSLLQKDVIAHLKKYEPIGCRDLSTKKLLEQHGVTAYFSGCVTMIFNIKDEQLGFVQTVDYSKNILHIDPPARIATTPEVITKSQHHTNGATLTNIIQSVQDLINYMSAIKVVTLRLHMWLPLACNDCNVVLMNNSTKKEFVNGDKDNAYQSVNRFNGLTELVYNKDVLRAFKPVLLRDVLTRMDRALASD